MQKSYLAWVVALVITNLNAAPPTPTQQTALRVVDLNVGETQEVRFVNGTKVQLKLADLREDRDPISHAVRRVRAQVTVDGHSVELASGNYQLPLTVGRVQIDCTISQGYYSNSGANSWGLDKAARFRLWPAGAPWIEPGTFVYPLNQRWFASGTQMSNEPVFVNAGEGPGGKKIYYHNDLDFGGCEGLVDVLAATNGTVISSAMLVLPGNQDTPVRPRYDVVYILDDRGWYYRYSHLYSIEETIKPGTTVKMGQKIGVLGKEGGSGGWAHLHFGIVSRQPSGKWGTQDAYAFVWEAYVRQYHPKIMPVARPHQVAWIGDTVTLDATKSWSAVGAIRSYEWTLSDRRTARGGTVEVTYAKPGTYSEVVKVTGSDGAIGYDFAVVQVFDPAETKQLPPSIQAAYAPSMTIKPRMPVTFKVRTFRTTYGEETWDFGDGTPAVKVKSDGNVKSLAKDGFAVTEHRFSKAGNYIVRVERSNERAEKATAHLWVAVDP